MNTVEIIVKIKMEKGKEITLKTGEAKELFEKLQEFFQVKKEIELVPYCLPWWPYTIPYMTTATEVISWASSTGNTQLLGKVEEVEKT